MSVVRVENLSVHRQGRLVCDKLSFSLERGEFVGLIGPNGAGKTTAMRAALGLLPFKGHSSLAALAPQKRAKLVAWMPQTREIAWPMIAENLVMLGRTPYLSWGGTPSAEDWQHVNSAFALMEIEQMRKRPVTQLSGGEQARVLIARALAQNTPLLFVDEPIAGLDPAHQLATMRNFVQLAEKGKSLFVSLHDLGLAMRYCTRLIMLNKGRIVADGAPGEILTKERLAQVFGVKALVEQSAHGALFQLLDTV